MGVPTILDPNGEQVNGRNGGPPWERFLTRYGLPTLLLLLVGYFFIWPVWNAMVEATPRIEQKVDQHIADTREWKKDEQKHQQRMEYWEWLKCIRDSKGDAAKQACNQQ